MKKFFVIICLCTVFVSNAQNTLNLIGLGSGTPASAAYSLRKLSDGYSGPLVRIKVGTSFYDIYPESNKFSLNSKISAPIITYNDPVSAAGSNALSSIITAGVTNATVAIWYDQSGRAIHVLSSSATASIISAGSINNINGQPTIKFSGESDFLESSSTVDYSSQTGATVNAIAQNSATTSFGAMIGTANGPSYPGFNSSYSSGVGYQSDGNGCAYGSNVITTDPKIITNIFTNQTTNLSNIYVNRVLQTPTGSNCPLTNTSGSKIYIGAARGQSAYRFVGNISEAFIFPKQISSSEQISLESNQNTFYFSKTVYISSSDPNNKSCPGTSVTFTASASGITNPTYQWYKNSIAISGATSLTYTTNTLSQNDVILLICSSIGNPSISSGLISWTINTPTISISVTGDGCPNKSSLSATNGLSSYAWYKDNALISGATTNTYSSPVVGDYKVTASNGTCTGTSAVRTISPCGVTADGRMRPITSPTTLVSHEGGVNFGTGVSELGTTVNATGISTTLGTIGTTTAVVSGVISSTNARTTSIGVIYSTDSNFGTYSTSSTQSNVVAGTYAISLSGLTASTTYHAKAFITNKAGTSYGPAVSFTTSSPPKAVGDLYGGGVIYYILQSGDNGYDANVQHGLIAQQTNEAHNSGITTWNVIALNGNTITAAQNDGTLVGRANTAAIIANQGAGTYLFKYVSTLSINSYTDWYVPSIRELNLFRNYVYNTTYCNSNGAFPYYWYSKANSSYKWAWGTYVSSTQSGSLYNTNYIEGNGVGTKSYSQTQSGDNFVYLAIRSF